MKAALAILLGAAMLVWPALVNGYPIVFSDTAALAAMGIEPTMGWDKPWAYGPLTLLLHWRISLWGVVAGQAVMVSLTLWLVARAAGLAGPWRFLALCVLVAVGSAAPWFVSFVMPDIFAPVAVLCVFLLGWGGLRRWPAIAVGALAAVAVAVHLAHLIIAAACVGLVLVLRPRRFLAAAAPLAAALAWLVATNAVGNHVFGVSPYGSVFALARLQADGPAADYVHSVCPAAPLRICGWSKQLPMNSDRFLWAGDSPVWGNGFGPTLFAPEASRIVRATLRYDPWGVLQAAIENTGRQLVRSAVGDTLGNWYLHDTVALLLRTYFPHAEQQRFTASLQVADRLAMVAAPLRPLRLSLLVVGALASLAMLPLYWRRRPLLARLASVVLVGVLANAFATGALSGPHDRYAARITWLVLLPPVLSMLGADQAARRQDYAGGLRTSAS